MKAEIIDLTGQKFGRLFAIKLIGRKKRHTYWQCKCDCGEELIVNSNNLRNGHTKSCGCLRKETTRQSHLTHGLGDRKKIRSGNRLYRCWDSMKQRCLNQNTKSYKHYGGRGITICEEWQDNFEPFMNWALSHGYRDDLTIDRIDVWTLPQPVYKVKQLSLNNNH